MVVVGAIMLQVEGVPGNISLWGWTMIVYSTVLGRVVPTFIFYWLLERVSSTKASLVGYLIPPIALVTGIVFLDEQLQFGIAIGGALILIGLGLTDRAESTSTNGVRSGRGRNRGPGTHST